MMETAILVIVVLGATGLLFGFVISFANKKFSMETNPLVHMVDDALPKGQCGGCGYAGCLAYAEAVVNNPDVPPNLCTPGKDAVAKRVAELTAKVSQTVESRIAHVRCSGTTGKSIYKYRYEGISDCIAAGLIQGGPKFCPYGCLGFGTCKKHCAYDAILLREDGLAMIDPEKCTGCGKCAEVCPKGVITMVKPKAPVLVNCNSKDKGAVVRKICAAGCLGCGICSKDCPHGAIQMLENLPVIDAIVCLEKCQDPVCIKRCPTKVLRITPGFAPALAAKN